ncbi:hypothetical protein BOSE62_70867 [Bosea sp. 62]|nr:hypothetical protein BOSE62_70867 [Bosea sp. 62]VXC83966.1 hypothetical protein BOSE29B_80743 [Bosea sp. 29B]
MAPGGVSQRICQSPCVERTAPCAWAGVAESQPQPMTASAAATGPINERIPVILSLQVWECAHTHTETAPPPRENAFRPCVPIPVKAKDHVRPRGRLPANSADRPPGAHALVAYLCRTGCVTACHCPTGASVIFDLSQCRRTGPVRRGRPGARLS